MQLTTTQQGPVMLITLPTRLVMNNAEALRNDLSSITARGYRLLAVDLSGVEFVDSSGLAVLIALYKQLQEIDGRLALLSPHANVRALIELTRLHQIFDIYEDQGRAIADLQAAA